MAHAFKVGSAGKAFKSIKEPTTSGTYINNKRAMNNYCGKNNCNKINTNVGSQRNLLLFNSSRRHANKQTIDNTQLYNNLITNLDLTDIPVIQNYHTGDVPTTITCDSVPFFDYNIDPSSALFGNSVCSINNYVHFMKYSGFNK